MRNSNAKRRLSFTLMGVSLLASCARIEVKDQAWFADAGKFGAAEIHTLSTYQRDIPKPEWDKMRVGMFCATGETFKEIKVTIEALCHMAGKGLCTFEDQKKIQTFFKRVEDAPK